VLGQSRAPDTLLVVNNGSTDDTEAMLKARSILHVTQDNVGSAGGWHLGLQYGLENGYDGLWLMDDDGFPDRGALEKLVNGLRPEMACLSSIVVCEHDPQYFVFPFPYLDRNGTPSLFRWPRKMPRVTDLKHKLENGYYPFAHLFNGALIRTSAVAKIGNVDKEYFMYGDEVDYFFRLRSFGPVCSFSEAIHYHPDVSNRPISNIGFYYYIKNTIIINHTYFKIPWLRDIVTILAGVGRTTKRNNIRESMSILLGRRRTSLTRAVYLGLRGRKGADFTG